MQNTVGPEGVEGGHAGQIRQERYDDDDGGDGCCAFILTFISAIFILLTLPLSIWLCMKQVQVRLTYSLEYISIAER